MLDFEVMSIGGYFAWTVFDTTDGVELAYGSETTRERATQAAVQEIADRDTQGTLYVVRNRTGWGMWHRYAIGWFPLPLTPTESVEFVRKFVTAIPGTASKPIHVITD